MPVKLSGLMYDKGVAQHTVFSINELIIVIQNSKCIAIRIISISQSLRCIIDDCLSLQPLTFIKRIYGRMVYACMAVTADLAEDKELVHAIKTFYL